MGKASIYEWASSRGKAGEAARGRRVITRHRQIVAGIAWPTDQAAQGGSNLAELALSMRRYSERILTPQSSCPPYRQAVAAGALEIFVFGNHGVAALLAEMPARTLQHLLVLIAQHAIRTTND
jgi:hypothetical protein